MFGNHKGLASDRWHGGVATIEQSPGDEVWGVVWKMNVSDLESLDEYLLVFLNSFPHFCVTLSNPCPVFLFTCAHPAKRM